MSPVHRTFSDGLPTRKPKLPVFHIAHDDDLDDDQHVPFPRSTSPPSPAAGPRSPPLSRGASAPVLLPNGKPLKPSLKSSSSAPTVITPPQSQHLHLRAYSAPSTPASTPKTVHFPEKDYGLATVRIFNRKARPAALSSPANGNGDETETEGEDTEFPFPVVSPTFNYEIDPTKSSLVPSKLTPDANMLLESLNFSSSSLPSSGTAVKPLLTGSVLVRNLAFEKHVAVRFTLDDWQTVSEVSARYVDSLSTLPPRISLSSPQSSSTSRARGWDRFTFSIRLEDYAHSLSTRTMWLVSRYRVTSTYPESGAAEHGPGGEWWDNNGGCNYRIGFRPAATMTPPRNKPRRETVSAPITSLRSPPQPPLPCKQNVLAHMSSVSTTKDVHGSEKHSVSLRVGKLNLCNYVPPTAHPTPSVSFASPVLPPLATSQPPPSDDDSASPASSTLSTPSVSPTMAPRVIIGRQPACQADRASEDDDDGIKPSNAGHIANWDWSAPGKLGSPPGRPRAADLLPRSESTLLHPEKVLADHSLYNAFVTQWCFAEGPSLSHGGYGDGGIMA